MVIIDSSKKLNSSTMHNATNIGIAINSTHEKGNAFLSLISKNANFYENSPGIVHRLENQALSSLPMYPLALSELDNNPSMFFPNYFFPASTSSNAASNTVVKSAPLARCPCCRESTSKMLCVVCALQALRVNKVRESYRTLFRHKAELCQKIEQQLRLQKNYQLDFYSKQQSICTLKAKISLKREYINRLRQRIHNIDVNNAITQKNNASLDDKIAKHVARLVLLGESTTQKHGSLAEAQQIFAQRIAEIVAELATIFPIEPLANRKAPTQSASGLVQRALPDAWRNALQNVHPRKPAYFTVKNLTVNDQSDLEMFFTEEQCKIIVHTSLPSRSMFGSLTANMISTPKICGCSTKPCRQTLGAILFAARLTELLSHVLDRRLPYGRLRQSWEELCSVYQKEAQSQSRTKASQSPLRANLFKLGIAIVYLSASCGILSARSVDLCTPIYNLHSLLQAITKRQKLAQNSQEANSGEFLLNFQPSFDSFDAKLHAQIVEEFLKIQSEEKRHDFSLDSVEEDWVNVAINPK